MAHFEMQITGGKTHLRSDEAKDVRWMSWWDHSLKWDEAWHFEYAATMFLMWSEGENPFSPKHHKTSDGSAESEVFSVKGLRWQVHLMRLNP